MSPFTKVGQNAWLPPTLYTSRLVLRPLEERDAASLFHYAKNPNVAQFTLWDAHRSTEDSLGFIRGVAAPNYANQVPEPLAITLREQPDVVIGTVGCFWTIKMYEAMELAYSVAEPHWGKGIAVEAARALLEYVFFAYPVQRIQARCKAQNARSLRVMEKLGMTYEGLHRSEIFHRGVFWDVHYAAILRDEWFGRLEP